MLAAILSGELTYPADMAPVAVALLKMVILSTSLLQS